MTLIQLGMPVRSEKVRGFQPPWRTVFVYECQKGHSVHVYVNAFRGKTPVPGVGAITCPQCEFAEKYGTPD